MCEIVGISGMRYKHQILRLGPVVVYPALAQDDSPKIIRLRAVESVSAARDF